jgi:mannose-1-phosphate guanylyltransferase
MHKVPIYFVFAAVFFASTVLHAHIFDETFNHRYCVILAGGHGQRLWPLTSPTKPKPLLSLDGKKTLLDETIERVQPLFATENMWLCSSKDYTDLFQEAVKSSITTFVTEPAARNTGPAVLYTCLQLYEHDPEAIVLFLPADAYISPYDYELFRTYLAKGLAAAQDYPSSIIIFGQKPRFASTGYGYIEVDYTSAYQAPYTVISFHEKPNAEVAQLYLEQDMLWNTCMFCAPVKTFLAQYAKHAPAMVKAMGAYNAGDIAYTDIIAEPIDRIVIEKSSTIKVIPMDISADDVGTVESFLHAQKEYNDYRNVVTIDSAHIHVLAQKKKIVGVIGLDDVYIVDTPDALLILKKGTSEKIKQLVARIPPEIKAKR